MIQAVRLLIENRHSYSYIFDRLRVYRSLLAIMAITVGWITCSRHDWVVQMPYESLHLIGCLLTGWLIMNGIWLILPSLLALLRLVSGGCTVTVTRTLSTTRTSTKVYTETSRTTRTIITTVRDILHIVIPSTRKIASRVTVSSTVTTPVTRTLTTKPNVYVTTVKRSTRTIFSPELDTGAIINTRPITTHFYVSSIILVSSTHLITSNIDHTKLVTTTRTVTSPRGVRSTSTRTMTTTRMLTVYRTFTRMFTVTLTNSTTSSLDINAAADSPAGGSSSNPLVALLLGVMPLALYLV